MKKIRRDESQACMAIESSSFAVQPVLSFFLPFFMPLFLSFFLTGCGTGGPTADKMLVTASEQRNGYECRLVEFTAADGDVVPAYLLVPDAAEETECPAVLMLHDHGARFDIGKEKLVSPLRMAPVHVTASSRQWADKYFDGAYMADSLASKGYVVLVPDALYWGGRSASDAQKWSRLEFGQAESEAQATADVDRRDSLKTLKKRVFDGQKVMADSLLRNGVVWAEKILSDDADALSLLASLPYVDESRIGAFGFSMGAHRCWLLSASSDVVKCGAAVCWMMMKEDYDDSSVSDLSMRIPSLRDRYDFPDVARFTFPKPMLFISGREDHLFPSASVEKAFDRMRRIYSEKGAAGAGECLVTEFSDEGHHCGLAVQREVYGFFDRHLASGG